MARADVVIIGAGLAGLSCAAELAERGANVFLTAKGVATTHWTHGGLDVAAPAGAATPREGVGRLGAIPGHPYATLASDVDAAVTAHLERVAAAGLPHMGSLDAQLVRVPTAVGALRPAAVVPVAQAAALETWRGDRLVLVGFNRYRDAWAEYAARNLTALAWIDGPSACDAVDVELPDTGARHNLNAQVLGHLFDDPDWRSAALDSIAAALPGSQGRIGLPAVLGIEHHQEAFAQAQRRLGRPIFEIVSLPPSVPGMRLFDAIRRRILAAGGRIQIGFDVVRVERDRRRIVAVHTEAASRSFRIAADAFVLATGGIAGAGIRADARGALQERVFGLPVLAPPRQSWFSDDPLTAHPLESAGLEVDDELRPADIENVRVIGSALAGMRYLAERCGDGVALASARRAAASLAGSRAVAA